MRQLRIIMLGTLIALVTCASLVATPRAGALVIGGKIGLNIATLTMNQQFTNLQRRAGIVGGAGLTFKVNRVISIEGQFLYSTKGVQWGDIIVTDEEGNYLGRGTSDVRLGYLEIPILARFSMSSESGGFGPHLLLGPYMGILLSASDNFSFSGQSYGKDVKGSYKSTDFGFILGAGADVMVGSAVVSIDGRFEVGLSDINAAGRTSATRLSWKTSTMSFLVGLGLQPW